MVLFLPTLKQQGHLDDVCISLCSVGSRKTGSHTDFGSQIWGIFAPNLTICGFDADADACNAANANIESRQVNWTEHHFPLAIANQIGEATLYVTQDPQCSSLYQPNETYLQRFESIRDLMKLEFTIETETTTLDAALQEINLSSVDFLQIDVQGANLQVLEGATQLLEHSVLGIQVEVEFSPLYLNQPLFADIDRFLRNLGFVLFDLSTIARTPRGSLYSIERPGQLLWADAIYLRDPFQANGSAFLNAPNQFKLACIADALDFTDYALELLERLTVQYGEQQKYNIADTIVQSLAQVPGISQSWLESFPTIQNIQPFLTKSLSEFDSEAVAMMQQVVSASPIEIFHSDHYRRHNQRRQEHLASLRLDLAERSVLEVGAGIGDHTSFFLDRNCSVVCLEGRPENLVLLEQRFPSLVVKHLDLDNPDPTFKGEFDIVYCYGLLYHLQKPTEAIAFMASCCQNLLLLETCVSFGNHEAINLCQEVAANPSQSISGIGCRPTRSWVFNQLKQHFPHVYMPITQPNHQEFPIDWTIPTNQTLTRSVYIASRQPLDNALLIENVPMKQQY